MLLILLDLMICDNERKYKYSNYNVLSYDDIEMKHEVSYLILENITEIGEGAFYGYRELGNVSLSSNLKIIGGYAFSYCINIKSIFIPSSVEQINQFAFFNCASLESFTFSENSSLINIEEQVFSNCTKLKSISMPHSLKKIGVGAFFGCINLESVIFSNEQKNLRLSLIDKQAFENCIRLKTFSFPKCLSVIRESLFKNCSNLESVTFHENSNISIISSSTFAYCIKLKSILIISSVEEIGFNAFQKCLSLESIIVSGGNKNYSNYKNDGVLYDKNINKIIYFPISSSQTDFIIPNTVVSIDSFMFSNRNKLKSFSFLKQSIVNSIGANAFMNCTNLTSINFSNLINFIGIGAFSYCTKLEAIILPSRLSEILNKTFKECSKLKLLMILSNISAIQDSAFLNCLNLKCICYCGTKIPVINSNAFSGCKNFETVYINLTYPDKKFGSFNVTKTNDLLDICNSMLGSKLNVIKIAKITGICIGIFVFLVITMTILFFIVSKKKEK